MCEISLEEFKSLTTKGKTEIRKDWRKCPLEKWNSTTARSYMNELSLIKFKVPYTCNSMQVENGMISQFKKSYGVEVLKIFIHRCFTQYKATKEYPTLSFGFMITYLKERILPPILKEIAEKKEREEALKRQSLEKDSDKFETKVGLF